MIDGGQMNILDYLTIIGSLLGIATAIRVFGKDGWNFYKRPKLQILEFDRSRDLRTFSLPDKQILGKFANLHINNLNEITATRCVATITILKTPPDVSLNENCFALHWADVVYSSKSTGADPVTIGPEPRRLDIAFTTPNQTIPGCWIAIPIALSNVLVIGNQEPNQVYLPPGEYEIEISVRCENGKGAKANFKLISPRIWQNLDMIPPGTDTVGGELDLGANGATGPFGATGPSSFSGPKEVIEGQLHGHLDETKEMTILVAPLYVNSRSDLKSIFFMKGSPGYYESARKRDQDYFKFWKEIKENQHLAIGYLRLALGEYFKNKSNTIDDKPDNDYLVAEKNLIEKIEQRYRELSK